MPLKCQLRRYPSLVSGLESFLFDITLKVGRMYSIRPANCCVEAGQISETLVCVVWQYSYRQALNILMIVIKWKYKPNIKEVAIKKTYNSRCY